MDLPTDSAFVSGTKIVSFFKTLFLSVLTNGFDTFEKGFKLGLDDKDCKVLTLVLQL